MEVGHGLFGCTMFMSCWPQSSLSSSALPSRICCRFTVRQLQQVFQGLLQSTPEKYNTDPSKLVRLWLHESERTCGSLRRGRKEGGSGRVGPIVPTVMLELACACSD